MKRKKKMNATNARGTERRELRGEARKTVKG